MNKEDTQRNVETIVRTIEKFLFYGAASKFQAKFYTENVIFK